MDSPDSCPSMVMMVRDGSSVILTRNTAEYLPHHGDALRHPLSFAPISWSHNCVDCSRSLMKEKDSMMVVRNGFLLSRLRQTLSNAVFVVLVIGPWIVFVWLLWPRH